MQACSKLYICLTTFYLNCMKAYAFCNHSAVRTCIYSYMSCVLRKPTFCILEIKAQICCTVIAQLISVFFAVHTCRWYKSPTFLSLCLSLCLYSPVCLSLEVDDRFLTKQLL